MGDKSPKSTQKKAGQKDARTKADKQAKKAIQDAKHVEGLKKK